MKKLIESAYKITISYSQSFFGFGTQKYPNFIQASLATLKKSVYVLKACDNCSLGIPKR